MAKLRVFLPDRPIIGKRSIKEVVRRVKSNVLDVSIFISIIVIVEVRNPCL